MVRRAAVRRLGNPCGATFEHCDSASQHDLDGGIDATVALRQLLMRLRSDLCDRLTPCLSCRLLEPRRTCLFPRDLFECYHCDALSIQRVGYDLAAGEFAPPQWPNTVYGVLSASFALALAGSSPCFPPPGSRLGSFRRPGSASPLMILMILNISNVVNNEGYHKYKIYHLCMREHIP